VYRHQRSPDTEVCRPQGVQAPKCSDTRGRNLFIQTTKGNGSKGANGLLVLCAKKLCDNADSSRIEPIKLPMLAAGLRTKPERCIVLINGKYINEQLCSTA
jgi:hypothetical protein